MTQTTWGTTQRQAGIPPLQHTYLVRTPGGDLTTVNRYQYSLALTQRYPGGLVACANGEAYRPLELRLTA